VKQDKVEALDTVNKRLDFIKTQMSTTEEQIKAKQGKNLWGSVLSVLHGGF
jgi:chaperonin cofactor prefoldin